MGQSITSLVAKSAGTTETVDLLISPYQILFNKLYLTDINFFKIDGLPSSAEAIKTIRENITAWYYALRNLAIVILLCILIYVGIRMAISTAAEQKARYKKMLVDWLVSFVLVFLLQYIIIITISLSNGLVDLFDGVRQTIEGSSTGLFGDIAGTLIGKSLWPFSATSSWGAAIVYIMVVGITIAFLIMYIKRMITIAFLIIISPVITITYSIDKMADNKSQALNTWLKEFVYNILIQPFHCIIYLVFVTTAMKLLNGTLAGMVLAIIMMAFIFQAETIVRKIFGFEKASSLGTGLASMAAVYGGFKALEKLGKKGGSSGGSGGGSGGNGGSGGSGGSGGPSPMPKVRNTSTPPSTNPVARASRAVKRTANQAKSKVNAAIGTVKRGANQVDRSISSVRGVGAVYGVGKKAITGFAKTAIKANKYTAKSGTVGKIVGSSMSAATNGLDNLGEIIGGGIIGGKVGEAYDAKVQNIKQNAQIKHNERVLATAYQNLETRYGAATVDRMTQTFSSMNPADIPSKITDVDQRLYAESIHSMKSQYQATGERNPNQRIMNTIAKVKTGQIKPLNP